MTLEPSNGPPTPNQRPYAEFAKHLLRLDPVAMLPTRRAYLKQAYAALCMRETIQWLYEQRDKLYLDYYVWHWQRNPIRTDRLANPKILFQHKAWLKTLIPPQATLMVRQATQPDQHSEQKLFLLSDEPEMRVQDLMASLERYDELSRSQEQALKEAMLPIMEQLLQQEWAFVRQLLHQNHPMPVTLPQQFIIQIFDFSDFNLENSLLTTMTQHEHFSQAQCQKWLQPESLFLPAMLLLLETLLTYPEVIPDPERESLLPLVQFFQHVLPQLPFMAWQENVIYPFRKAIYNRYSNMYTLDKNTLRFLQDEIQWRQARYQRLYERAEQSQRIQLALRAPTQAHKKAILNTRHVDITHTKSMKILDRVHKNICKWQQIQSYCQKSVELEYDTLMNSVETFLNQLSPDIIDERVNFAVDILTGLPGASRVPRMIRYPFKPAKLTHYKQQLWQALWQQGVGAEALPSLMQSAEALVRLDSRSELQGCLSQWFGNTSQQDYEGVIALVGLLYKRLQQLRPGDHLPIFEAIFQPFLTSIPATIQPYSVGLDEERILGILATYLAQLDGLNYGWDSEPHILLITFERVFDLLHHICILRRMMLQPRESYRDVFRNTLDKVWQVMMTYTYSLGPGACTLVPNRLRLITLTDGS